MTFYSLPNFESVQPTYEIMNYGRVMIFSTKIINKIAFNTLARSMSGAIKENLGRAVCYIILSKNQGQRKNSD